MKVMLFGLLLITNVFADMLGVHQRIIPISLLQVKKIAKKKDKVINFVIVVSGKETTRASTFEGLLPQKLKSFIFNTKIVKEESLRSALKEDVDAIYVFGLSDKGFEEIKEFSINHAVPTFANEESYLDKGMLLFIDKKQKIDIKLNKEIMKKAKVPFSRKFLSVTSFYGK